LAKSICRANEDKAPLHNIMDEFASHPQGSLFWPRKEEKDQDSLDVPGSKVAIYPQTMISLRVVFRSLKVATKLEFASSVAVAKRVL
jgi:hypothetical protein